MAPSANDYWFASEADSKRLTGQHAPIKASMGGRLVIAPIDLTVPRKVFDSGTSDGLWLIDFARDHPAGHTLVGSDIDETRFPQNLPSSMTLVKQDMHDPYPKDWFHSFDLVHQRLVLAGSRGDPRKPLMPLLDLVKPGGWVQLIEAANINGADDGPAMRDFVALIREMFSGIGTDPDFAKGLAGILDEAGFIKIGEFLAPYSLGAKCPDPALRDVSREAVDPVIQGLLAVGKTLPGLKCMTTEQLDSLPDRFSTEIAQKGGYYPMRVVWGQRPLS